MDNVSLKLTPRDASGNPLQAASPAQPILTLAMKFLKDLPPNKSLYRFRFDLADAKPASISFNMTSDDAGDLFHYFEDVYYGDPAPASLQGDTTDENGVITGTVDVTIALPTSATVTEPPSVINYSFTLSGNRGSVIFSLAVIDNWAYYLFFDTLLWSHPPSPPR